MEGNEEVGGLGELLTFPYIPAVGVPDDGVPKTVNWHAPPCRNCKAQLRIPRSGDTIYFSRAAKFHLKLVGLCTQGAVSFHSGCQRTASSLLSRNYADRHLADSSSSGIGVEQHRDYACSLYLLYLSGSAQRPKVSCGQRRSFAQSPHRSSTVYLELPLAVPVLSSWWADCTGPGCPMIASRHLSD